MAQSYRTDHVHGAPLSYRIVSCRVASHRLELFGMDGAVSGYLFLMDFLFPCISGAIAPQTLCNVISRSIGGGRRAVDTSVPWEVPYGCGGLSISRVKEKKSSIGRSVAGPCLHGSTAAAVAVASAVAAPGYIAGPVRNIAVAAAAAKAWATITPNCTCTSAPHRTVQINPERERYLRHPVS